MEGELVLPMLHAQYSSLPHQNTYRVEDSLGVVWDDVVQCLCGAHDVKFPPRFLKNPLHISYKFISQLVYLIEVILPHTAFIQNTKTSFTDTTAVDVETYLQFLTTFTNSIASAKDNKNEKTLDADDIQTIIELCNAVDDTIHMPLFRKYDPLKELLGKVLKIIVQLFPTLEPPLPSAASPPQVNLVSNNTSSYLIQKTVMSKN
jgi:hypothetical protein